MYFEEEIKQKNGSHVITETVNCIGKARIARETREKTEQSQWHLCVKKGNLRGKIVRLKLVHS